MMNFKVLIAEDEPLVARFIFQIVNGIDGLEVLDCCKSGEDATAWLTKDEPQILVTDIRMRGMTGLELIKIAKNIKPDLQVVIISGYGLFEYAKEALRLGIEEYLLKPVDPEELSQTLRTMRDDLRRQLNEEKNSQLKRLLRSGSYERVAELYDCRHVHLLMVCQSCDPESTLELCTKAISQLEIENVNAAIWHNAVLLLEALHDDDTVIHLKEIERWLKEKRDTSTFSMLSSRKPVSVAELQSILPDFYDTLRKVRVFGKSIQLAYPTEIERSGHPYHFPERISAAVAARNLNMVKEIYDDLFSDWERESRGIREIKSGVCAFSAKCQQAFKSPESLAVINDKISEALDFADSFTEAHDSTWAIIEDAFASRDKKRQETKINLHALYEEVSQYVRVNCGRNDSLQEISNRFHVSQPYVSRAFRTYAGISYKEFCLQQKIEVAKAMILAEPDVRFKDVAFKIGIEQSYFSTVFHRMTGMYPSEFKAAHERTEEK